MFQNRDSFDEKQRLSPSSIRLALKDLKNTIKDRKEIEFEFKLDPKADGHDDTVVKIAESHEDSGEEKYEKTRTLGKVILPCFVVNAKNTKKPTLIVQGMARDSETCGLEDRAMMREIGEIILKARAELKQQPKGTLLIPLKLVKREHAVLVEVDLDSKPAQIIVHDWRGKWRNLPYTDHLKKFVEDHQKDFTYKYKGYATQENPHLCGYYAVTAIQSFLVHGDSREFPDLKMTPENVTSKAHFERHAVEVMSSVMTNSFFALTNMILEDNKIAEIKEDENYFSALTEKVSIRHIYTSLDNLINRSDITMDAKNTAKEFKKYLLKYQLENLKKIFSIIPDKEKPKKESKENDAYEVLMAYRHIIYNSQWDLKFAGGTKIRDENGVSNMASTTMTKILSEIRRALRTSMKDCRKEEKPFESWRKVLKDVYKIGHGASLDSRCPNIKIFYEHLKQKYEALKNLTPSQMKASQVPTSMYSQPSSRDLIERKSHSPTKKGGT